MGSCEGRTTTHLRCRADSRAEGGLVVGQGSRAGPTVALLGVARGEDGKRRPGFRAWSRDARRQHKDAPGPNVAKNPYGRVILCRSVALAGTCRHNSGGRTAHGLVHSRSRRRLSHLTERKEFLRNPRFRLD